MGLPYSQRRILATIENELEDDPELSVVFLAFTIITRRTAVPAAEQLPAQRWLAGWRSFASHIKSFGWLHRHRKLIRRK
jgi:hypothetical protein